MNKKYWIWLASVAGYGSSLPKKLFFELKTAENIYNATPDVLRKLNCTEKQIQLMSNKSLDTAIKTVEWCKNNNVNLLCMDDPRYPVRLISINNPPAVIYYIGKLYDIDSKLCLAGVGTRKCTKYGYNFSYTFSYDLAKSGAIIISGLAAGIDSACHNGALDAGGKTIAVLGCSINKVYPPENRELMKNIARNGLLITEYSPFTNHIPKFFSMRNRIISALSLGVMVFEADEGSGSLITANNAKHQGKKVYALPGKIGETLSLGTNGLIKNGASPISDVKDVLGDFLSMYKGNVVTTNLIDSPVQKNNDSFVFEKAEEKKIKETKKTNTTIKKQAAVGPNESGISSQHTVSYDTEPGTTPHTLKKQAALTAEEAECKMVEADLCELDQTEKDIYMLLSYDVPKSADELALPDHCLPDILSSLTMLEIKGYISLHPGNRYTRRLLNHLK